MKKRVYKYYYFILDSINDIEIPVICDIEITYHKIGPDTYTGVLLNWKPAKGYENYKEFIDKFFEENNNKIDCINSFIDIELM